MRTTFWSSVRVRVIVAALVLAACDTGTVGFSGGGHQVTGPTGPDSTAGLTLTITPNPIRVSVGSQGQFSARLQDALGNVLTDVATWASNNTGVATVDQTGLATGVNAGNTTITVAEHGLTTSANLEVDPVPVASVVLAPRTDTLQVGTQVVLSATTKDAVGNTLTGRQITWTSRIPSIATVNATGTVTAVAVGTDSVLATSEGVTGAAVITVVNVPVVTVVVAPTPDTIPQGGTIVLSATPKDGGGNPLVRAVTWSSGNTGIATVSNGGLVTGVGLGTTTITATSGGVPGTASVTVIQVPVASVTVTPKTPSMQVGNTVQLSATTRDAKGNTLTGRVVTWGSGNGNATVSGTGLVTGVSVGTSVITATSETINGTATATVTAAPPTLVRIILSPDTATINTGGTKQFSTVGKYSDSSTSAVTPTYSATGGSVTASGLYTAGSTGGTFRVIATSSGLADTSTLTVVKPPVALVIVTPALDTVSVGSSYQLTATTKDAGGNVLTGRVVTWGSSNTAAATVNGSGLVTAAGAGTAIITATSETIPGTATTVATVVLAASVSVAPANPTVVRGTTVGLSATARDKNGNILTGHPITWSSLAGTIASVNGSGTVTGVAVGTAGIKASVDTASGTTTVTVDTLTTIQPWLLEDFSSYLSTSDLISDPRGIYSTGEDVNTGQVFLDKTVGDTAFGYHLTQSMRYDFPDQSFNVGGSTTGRCGEYEITRNISLPGSTGEVWVESIERFSPGWTVDVPSSWNCTSEPAYKHFFGRINGGVGRFSTGTLPGRWTSEYPPGGQEISNDYSTTFDPGDGKWHQFRWHWKVGSSGILQLWLDGQLVINLTGINVQASSIYGISMGRNMNAGPGQNQSIWWGRIAVYNTNPGW